MERLVLRGVLYGVAVLATLISFQLAGSGKTDPALAPTILIAVVAVAGLAC
jgi:hypothetical protein